METAKEFIKAAVYAVIITMSPTLEGGPGLKPLRNNDLYGTAKAVPFRKQRDLLWVYLVKWVSYQIRLRFSLSMLWEVSARPWPSRG